MGEQRQIRLRSVPTKRCTANGVMNEFIVVDDDEVIILDFPDDSSSKGKAPETSRTSRNEPVLQRVISIDDDDDDTENVHKGGSSSSGNSNADDDDDCQFVQEKRAAFRFSKCNQAFPTAGTRFGLGTDSDSDFSESDCSDCEILEGPQGEVREQWEKAFLEKKKKAGKAGLSHEEEAGPSNLQPGFESRTEQQHDQTPSFFTRRNADKGKKTSSAFYETQKSGKAGLSHEEEAGPSNLHHCETSSKQVEKQTYTVPVQSETPKESQMRKVDKEVVQEEEDASKSSPPHTCDGDGGTPPVVGVSNGARCEGESREPPIIDPIPSTSEQVQAPQVDVILNREMFKETDEYKKVQEEEWESRQRQLQLQAEEAQRQRKRRKLANTRQLEMERRQKERVEEVRETQKKDEESMNMKEKVRADITKSLKLLEIKCVNMASLLRGLGIPVNGGLAPPPQEVHAAYKRALLKFHPDRSASTGDIKQQVEAEEKFKLISRMKDKFLS